MAACGGAETVVVEVPTVGPKVAPAGYDFPAQIGRGAGAANAAPTGWVVDAANVVPPPEKAKLNARLAGFEKQTKHQFVVVTVGSLGGHDIKDYATRLGNFWGVGRAGADDGVLLVVAPNERKVRIATGHGLEKALTDEEAEAILNKDVLPRFRQGDMTAGILAGSEAIIREIS